MKLALELEFPDAQAAHVLRLLQSLPDVTTRILTHPATAALNITEPALTEAEQNALLHQLFGSWQSDESGEELNRQIYGARQDQPRDVEL